MRKGSLQLPSSLYDLGNFNRCLMSLDEPAYLPPLRPEVNANDQLALADHRNHRQAASRSERDDSPASVIPTAGRRSSGVERRC